MKKIYIEKIYCEDKNGFSLVGVGSIWSSRAKAVNFLRQVKEEQGGFVTGFSEEELQISYKTFRGTMHLLIEPRYVG